MRAREHERNPYSSFPRGNLSLSRTDARRKIHTHTHILERQNKKTEKASSLNLQYAQMANIEWSEKKSFHEIYAHTNGEDISKLSGLAHCIKKNETDTFYHSHIFRFRME